MSIKKVWIRFLLLLVLLTAVLGTKRFAITHASGTEPVDPRREQGDLLPLSPQTRAMPNPSKQPTSIYLWSSLVYQSYRDNNWEIYLTHGDNSESRLTNSATPEIHPRLNRGSNQIVFASKQAGEADYDLYMMNSDATNSHPITINDQDDVYPVWSPDNSKILFQSYRDGQAEIYVMNADGSGVVRLTNDPDFDGFPSWSPDGSRILFTSRRTGGYRIYVMNADGSGLTQLSNQPYSLRAVWSPDGSRIAYDADGDGDTWQDLWVMNADGSNQHLIYDPYGDNDAWASGWSPDGAFVTFTEVSFISYNNNWYWTNAYLFGTAPDTSSTFLLAASRYEWNPDWQTADISAPNLSVVGLPAVSPATFGVNWSASDDISGVQNYDVQVKVGLGGAWNDLLTDTTATAVTYTGTGGQDYFFRVRATDNASNSSGWVETNTQVETLAPQTAVSPLPPYSRLNGLVFPIQWQGHDPGNSGIASYNVQYRVNHGPWVDWQTNTPDTSANLSNIIQSQPYEFRVNGTDKAQNQEPWPTYPDTQTTFYRWGIRGHLYDNLFNPVGGATVTVSPSTGVSLMNNTTGEYARYLSNNANTYQVTWSKAGYGSLPTTGFASGADVQQDIMLPPANNVVADGSFESGDLGLAWTAVGPITPTLTDTQHTGHSAAFLGVETPGLSNPTQIDTISGLYAQQFSKVLVDSHHTTHLLWGGYAALYYLQKPEYGAWDTPTILMNSVNITDTAWVWDETYDVIHMIWYQPDGIYYRQIRANGTPSVAEKIGIFDDFPYAPPAILVDPQGTVHVAWIELAPDHTDDIVYYERTANGVWSDVDMIYSSAPYAYTTHLVLKQDSLNRIHFFWTHEQPGVAYDTILHIQKLGDGDWEQYVNVSQGFLASDAPFVDTDGLGNTHIIWRNTENNQTTYYYTRVNSQNQWLPTEVVFSLPYSYWASVRHTVATDGTVYTVWEQDGSIFYRSRHLLTGWDAPKLFAAGEGGTIFLNKQNLPTIVWLGGTNGTGTLYEASQDRNGRWSLPQTIVNNPQRKYDIALNFDETNQQQLVWLELSGNIDYAAYFVGSKTTAVAGHATLSQALTIPANMTSPILSFAYDLQGLDENSDSIFTVGVSNGISPTEQITFTQSTNSWQYASLDLSPWVSMPVTLTFDLYQAAPALVAGVYLDEVALGSAWADLVVQTPNQAALPGETVVYKLQYGNRGGTTAVNNWLTFTLPSGVTFVSASIPPLTSTNTSLVWQLADLPGQGDVQTIVVTGTMSATAVPFTSLPSTLTIASQTAEIEIANNTITSQTFVGRLAYLSLIHHP